REYGCRALISKIFQDCEKAEPAPSAVPTCLSKSSFVLNRTNCPLNGSRPDESIRSALDYGDLSETFACAFGQSSWNGTSALPKCRRNGAACRYRPRRA